MILGLRSIPMLAFVLSASAGVTVACGDDADGDDGHSDDEPQLCKDISSVCHDLDTGSGTAHDCHEQAHAGDAAVCEMISAECLAFCSGGTGTESGSTSPTTATEDSGTTHDDASTGHASDDSTGTDGSTGHDSSTGDDHGTGSETAGAVCPLLGSGCHDIKTVEGQECHDIGHDDDEAACQAALVECTEICGL